ncbi:avidin-like [Ambystoma mexicanum]|uniref:avidin-like n=1 Tax=Ambystoma mexicanum TaxID=8296 RepID=UPI0037E749CB
MAQTFLPRVTLLLLAGFALTTSDERKCNLSGTWLNDLGSTMTIGNVDSNGVFRGSYLTAVASTNTTIIESPLIGCQQKGSEPTFGMLIKWNFTESITSFTGQCFVDEDGKERLETMWLLRRHAPKKEDNWAATRVGTNYFIRSPSPEDLHE